MSRPLIVNAKREGERQRYHHDVFDRYGNLCWFGVRVAHPKKRASDAAHILKKSHLGTLRYARVEFSRPLCRECHVRQESNNPAFRFSYDDYLIAVNAHNEIATVKLNVIDRDTYEGRACG